MHRIGAALAGVLLATAAGGAHAAPERASRAFCGWVVDAQGDTGSTQRGGLPGGAAGDPVTDILAAEVSTRTRALRFDVDLAAATEAQPGSPQGYEYAVFFGLDRDDFVAVVQTAVEQRAYLMDIDSGKRVPLRARIDAASKRVVVSVPYDAMAALGTTVGRRSVVARAKVLTARQTRVDYPVGGPAMESSDVFDEATTGRTYTVGTRSCADGRA